MTRVEMLEQLSELMAGLYRTGDYYVSIPAGESADYEQEYWHTIADPDGNVRDRLAEREKHLEDVAEELRFVNGLDGGRMLDVGCGLGFFLSGVGAQWERHGLEVSAFAAEHAAQYGEIHEGPLLTAPYADESFDLIVIHHVIEHMDDPVANIRFLHRLLRPGGRLLLGTPDFDSGCARRFGKNYRLLHDETHISLFSNDSMHRFLRDHGFRIDAVDYPYFETRYFDEPNLVRMLDADAMSPPFYGNFMTFYATRV